MMLIVNACCMPWNSLTSETAHYNVNTCMMCETKILDFSMDL